MTDTVKIRLSTHENTVTAGISLAQTLYTNPTIILLSGDLGAGKTTLVQALAKGLGIQEHVTSPTYALEQRYALKNSHVELKEFVHVDLYRLQNQQADNFVEMLDIESSIVCIEWPERLSTLPKNCIHVHLEDLGEHGRDLTIDFQDISIPTEEEILLWRQEVQIPENVNKHCDAVAMYCEKITNDCIADYTLCRPHALKTAARLHDLFRFLDFKESAAPDGITNTEEQKKLWEKYKARYSGIGHEFAAEAFLREKKFDALAKIVKSHGLKFPLQDRTTIEQKILYYADKRLIGDRFVTLAERFDDFANRYADGKLTSDQEKWFLEAKVVGEELGIKEMRR